MTGAGQIDNPDRRSFALPWLRCPFCTARLPSWAARAQWEHVDQAHRDDGPADTSWVDDSGENGDPKSVHVGPDSSASA